MRAAWISILSIFMPFALSAAESIPVAFNSETLFIVPWDEGAAFSHLHPTQGPSGFRPAIKSPSYYDVNPKGDIFIGSNAYPPPEIRKYDSKGNLHWKVLGAPSEDRSVPLEVRKFCKIGSICCDNDGSLYVAEQLRYHEDKIAKYGPDGQFHGMVRTYFSNPWLLRRNPDGGIRFVGWQKDLQTGQEESHPCFLKDGVARKAPLLSGIYGPDGESYSGLYHKGEKFEEFVGDARRELSVPNPMRDILIGRHNRAFMEKGIERHEHTVRISYPHPLTGCWTLGADHRGNLYVDIAIDSVSEVPSTSTHRLVKVNPATMKILGEVNLVPGARTLDMLSYPPVIIPETGEMYEFADLRDGLHVIKHTPIE